jgi:hypothetical protein
MMRKNISTLYRNASTNESQVTLQHAVCLVFVLILLLGNLCLGIYLFSTGFFPAKMTLPGSATNSPVHNHTHFRILCNIFVLTHLILFFDHCLTFPESKAQIRSIDLTSY